MFSRSKKIDKQNIPDDDAESDPSITSTEHNSGMIEETVTTSLATMLHNVEEAAPKVIEEVVRHVNPENLVQQMTKANPVAEFKESAPVIDEKKPAEFFNKFVEKAKKTKEEVKEQLHKFANEGSQAYKAITTTSKDHKTEPPQLQPLEKAVNVIDESNAPPVPLSSLAQGVQDEVVDAATGAVTRAKTVETTNQGGEQEEEKKIEVEDNCVTSLAQGLQKICGQWSNKKED
ncbi:hypothetical protein SOVF_164820 [Spinacia oleracea]|nr:hypothetical protein SOVF_164820 [Spinacia oleracea]